MNRHGSPPKRSPALPPEEIERRRAAAKKRDEARRRAMAREAAIRRKIKEENKRRRIAAAKTFFYRFLVYLVFLALIMSFFALFFFIGLHKTDKVNDKDIVYYLADEKKTKIPYYSVMRDGAMYVDFTQISEKFALTLTGSYNEMKFVISENGEYVRFSPNDYTAEVNGNLVRLDSPPVLEGEKLFVPASFIERYMDGISVKYSEKERSLTVKRTSYGAEDREMCFYLKKAAPAAPVAEPDDLGEITTVTEN